MKSEIEVPDGWEVTKLGELFTLEYGKGLTKKDRDNGRFPVYGSNGIVGHHSKCLFKGPSIIVGRKGTIGAIVWSDLDAWAIDTTYYIQFKKKELDMKWLFYKLNSLKLSKLNMATGIPGLNRNLVYSKNIALPPLPEQQKIAEILSKVDEQIQQTEEIIEKTEELKRGLMQKLLLRGIGHTKFKQTELGEIPEEWKIKRLDESTTVIISNVDKKINEKESSVLLCNYKDVYDNDYIDSKLDFMRGTAKDIEINKFSLKKDDVIITKDSETKFDIAIPSVVIEKLNNVICGYHLAILRPKSDLLDGVYLMNVLKINSVNNHFVKFAQGLTRFGLTIDAIKRAKIPLPVLEEQKQIASILSKVDNQIQDNKSQLENLKQLKKGIMQDLLTGRVRVTV